MKNKIHLEYPYSEDWSSGYVVINSENRKNVILYNSHGDRSTTSLARYVVSCLLGEYLPSGIEVDHVDNDKTNEKLYNYQLLTREDNTRKQNYLQGKNYVKIICPECKTLFYRSKNKSQLIPCLKGKITCCSRSCSGRFSQKSKNMDSELRSFISEESIVSAEVIIKNPDITPYIDNKLFRSIAEKSERYDKIKEDFDL